MDLRSFLSVLLFLVTAQILSAQHDPVVRISGQIISAETGEPVPFVHIINESTKQGATTDASGAFRISMGKADTLVFSSVGFEKYRFTLTDDFADDKLFIKIELNTATFELQPVEVFAFKDAESFKEAILEMEPPEDNRPIHIPGSYHGPRKEVKASPLNPVSYVFSAFSKEEKEKRMLAKAAVETQRWHRLKEKYDFIKRIADIEDDELDDFLQFCEITDKKVEASTEYELALAVNTCLAEYKNVE